MPLRRAERQKNMQFTVVTGLSGSGKTQVIRYLEDLGFFCIDNMPPILIHKLADMFFSANKKFDRIALVIDVRVGEMINDLVTNLNMLRENGCSCTLLFVDASDEVLVKRYKENRRAHPISSEDGLLGSIRRERKILEGIYNEADYVIDTSGLSINDLHKRLKEIYIKTEEDEESFEVNINAFGFKYGIPLDADLVFDVRCFPNPFYVAELKNKTGNDREVQAYVMSAPEAVRFFSQLDEMIKSLLPLYIEEGKQSLTIAIGCTGGKHRSVTLANKLGESLRNAKYNVNMIYRDISKGKKS